MLKFVRLELISLWFFSLLLVVVAATVQGMWYTGEAVNYSTGLGFNGYDEKGRSKWNLLDNAEVFDFEVASRLFIFFAC